MDKIWFWLLMHDRDLVFRYGQIAHFYWHLTIWTNYIVYFDAFWSFSFQSTFLCEIVIFSFQSQSYYENLGHYYPPLILWLIEKKSWTTLKWSTFGHFGESVEKHKKFSKVHEIMPKSHWSGLHQRKQKLFGACIAPNSLKFTQYQPNMTHLARKK